MKQAYQSSPSSSGCSMCGGDLTGKEIFRTAHRYFPDCIEMIKRQFVEFATSGKVPPWYTGPDPRNRLASLVDQYAGTINEKAYPDAVAALLRFRSMLLLGELSSGVNVPVQPLASTRDG